MKTLKKNNQVKTPEKSAEKVSGMKNEGPRDKRESPGGRRSLNESADTEVLEDYEEMETPLGKNQPANKAHDIEDIKDEEAGRVESKIRTNKETEKQDVRNESPDKTSPDEDNDKTKPDENGKNVEAK